MFYFKCLHFINGLDLLYMCLEQHLVDIHNEIIFMCATAATIDEFVCVSFHTFSRLRILRCSGVCAVLAAVTAGHPTIDEYFIIENMRSQWKVILCGKCVGVLECLCCICAENPLTRSNQNELNGFVRYFQNKSNPNQIRWMNVLSFVWPAEALCAYVHTLHHSA